MLFHEVEVTISLSNLYKQSFVVSSGTEKRIINYNPILQEKMEDAQRTVGGLRFASFDTDESGNEEEEETFVAGIEATSAEVEPEPQVEELIEEANRQAEELLLSAHRQVEEILMQAKNEADSFREQVRSEAVEQGLLEASEEIEQRKRKLEEQFQEKEALLQENFSLKQEAMEREIVSAITTVMERVFHVQFGEKKEILLKLVQKTLSNVEIGKSFRIRVSERNKKYLDEHMDSLRAQVGGEVSIEVACDASMGEESCMIETEFGVFDCGIDTQMKSLVKEIQKLSM